MLMAQPSEPGDICLMTAHSVSSVPRYISLVIARQFTHLNKLNGVPEFVVNQHQIIEL